MLCAVCVGLSARTAQYEPEIHHGWTVFASFDLPWPNSSCASYHSQEHCSCSRFVVQPLFFCHLLLVNSTVIMVFLFSACFLNGLVNVMLAKYIIFFTDSVVNDRHRLLKCRGWCYAILSRDTFLSRWKFTWFKNYFEMLDKSTLFLIIYCWDCV